MSKVILSEITALGEPGTLKVSPGTKIDISKTNSYLQLPKGSTEERPIGTSFGEIRYNTDTKLVEYYDGTQWQEIESPEDYDSISKAGLVLHLDASSQESYSGSGTKWYDLTSYGNDGTLVNGPTFNSLDKSFEFNGSADRVTVNHNVPALTTFSIELFLNTSLLDGSQDIFFDQYASLRFELLGNKYRIHFGNGGSWYFTDHTTNHNVSLNTWEHIVWSWDGSQSKIYVNGSLDSTRNYSIAAGSTSGTAPFTLGQHSPDTNYNWNGKIASVKLYNRALTPGEVWKNYAALAPRFGIDPIPSIPTNGLVLHLDAANYQSYPRSGTTWYDISGNGNNVEMDSVYVPTFERNSVFRVIGGSNFETTTANIPLTRLTMVGWYKSITRGTGAYPRLLELHKTGTTVSYSHALAVDDNGSLRAWVETGDVATSYNRIASADDPTTYPLNEWIMFAYTYDGSTGRIYVNGVNTASAAGSSNLLDTVNVITIGAIPDFNTYQHNQYCLDAEISKIMIYNRALTTLEINELFNNLRTRYGI